MKDELTPAEIQHFVYAGMFMIYMQALRFLTDYLENDKYYGAPIQIIIILGQGTSSLY
jgi:hypothetical protein